MKKVISLLLAVMLTCGIFAFQVSAEESKALVFERQVNHLYFYQYFMGEPFDEGESPTADVAYGFVTSYDTDKFEAYKEEDTEKFTSHKIPQQVFEDAVAARFTVNDALLASLRQRNLEDGYYYIYMGGFGDQMPEYYYVGCTSEGNNVYTVYGYLGERWDDEAEVYDTYIPKEGEVEGIDYARKQYVYIDQKGNTQVTNYAVRITTAIKCKVEYTDTVKFLSYLEVPMTEIPEESKLAEKPVIEEKQTSVTVDPEAFVPGTVLNYKKVTEGDMFEKATQSLPENAAFVLMDITATNYEGQSVQPNGKVKVTFRLPDGYKDADVYYLPESGDAVKLESTVDSAKGTVTVLLEHFSCYAVVNTTPANEESTPDVPDTSVPEAEASDTSESEASTEENESKNEEISDEISDEISKNESAPEAEASEGESKDQSVSDEKKGGFNVIWVIIPVAIIAVSAVVVIIKKKK